jgi:predicted nucleic acid-binding protein
MALVVDASIMLALQFQDEETGALAEIGTMIAEGGAVAPVHWRAEIANGLVMAMRRGRIEASVRDDLLADLAEFSIEIDTESTHALWSDTLQLCDRHRLTVYDAAYLEVAIRRRLPLATLDRALATNARLEGVRILGVPAP